MRSTVLSMLSRSVHVSEMFLCRVEDARLAECWQEWDEYGLRQQLMAQR